eukprot:260351_1
MGTVVGAVGGSVGARNGSEGVSVMGGEVDIMVGETGRFRRAHGPHMEEMDVPGTEPVLGGLRLLASLDLALMVPAMCTARRSRLTAFHAPPRAKVGANWRSSGHGSKGRNGKGKKK